MIICLLNKYVYIIYISSCVFYTWMLSYIYYYRLYAHVIFFILYHYISYITHTNIPLRRSYPFSYKKYPRWIVFSESNQPVRTVPPCRCPVEDSQFGSSLGESTCLPWTWRWSDSSGCVSRLGLWRFWNGGPSWEFKAGPTVNLNLEDGTHSGWIL